MKRLRGALAPIGAALVALWIHGSDRFAPFFADDWLFLDATRHRSLWAALTAPDPIGNFARPVGRQLWFWLLDRIGGGSPEAFHIANLALFALAVLLLGALVRREAGERAAAIACACFALSHAADVPLRWASGSQDLLALTLALGALLLAARNGIAAAALLLLALLSKETVLLTPFVALLLARRTTNGWADAARRALPLFGAVVLWLLTAGARGFAHTMGGGGIGGAGAFGASGGSVAASLVAFARTLAGAEWAPTAHPAVLPGAIAAVVVAAALVLLSRSGRAAVAAPPAPPAPSAAAAPAWLLPAAGVVWALAGALPVAAVAGIWSAYYFLFALAGAAFALGVLFAGAPAWAAMLVVAALGMGAAQSRTLPAFAPAANPWSAVSHVNRQYLVDGSRRADALLEDLQRVLPHLEPRTTIFFSGLPSYVALQAGDGPLLRVAYRDSSLRSYYLADLTVERARRGPYRIVQWSPELDRLHDDTNDPMCLDNVAMSMLVRDRMDAVDGALDQLAARGTLRGDAAYVGAWRKWERGDHDAAAAELSALGYQAMGSADDVMQQASDAIAAGDTARASALARDARRTHVLDAAVHGLLSDLWLPSESSRGQGVLEAYASRVLAPQFPYSWRRWASVQILFGHYAEAAASLERYFVLAPEARAQDSEAVEWLKRLSGGPPAALR